MYHIDRLNIIELGVQQDNLRPLQIDVSSWLEKEPELTFVLALKRPGESSHYLVTPTVKDGVLNWTVTAADTGLSGYGEGQVRASKGSLLWKTKTFRTHIQETLAGTEGTAPSPTQSWVDTVMAKSLIAEGYAVGKQNGTDVGSTSTYYHNNTKWYAEKAETSVAQGGYIFFEFNDQDELVFTRIGKVDVDFSINEDGQLEVTGVE